MDAVFALLTDYTFQVVAMGTAVLGIVSGVLGSFAVLRKQSLIGDGVSHSALAGVVGAFILTGVKNTQVLLFGAFVTGLMASLLIILFMKHNRVRFDSILALVMSVFFGLGLVLLTYTQRMANSNQAGLNSFIYGQASTILKQDVVFTSVCGLVLLFLVFLFYKEFKLLCFDPIFAQTLGFSTKKLDLLLSVMIVIAIIIGLQTVGVILMSAMLIAPAVSARQWTNSLWGMLLLSALFGAISGVCGTMISSSYSNMPTGPVIVVCISVIAFVSMMFAPNRGVIHKIYTRNKLRNSGKTTMSGGDDVSSN